MLSTFFLRSSPCLAVALACAFTLGLPSVAAAAISTHDAAADAYVSEALPTTMFTTGPVARIEGGADPDNIGYLRFDVGALSGSVTRVVLRYNVTNVSAGAFRVHRASSWVTGVTWNTRPAFDATALATSAANTSLGWHEVVLPSSAVSAGASSSLALVATTNDALEISTKEGTGVAQLVITTADVTSPPPPPPPPPAARYGAQLPLSYSLSSITGTRLFVATNGNNASPGTSEAAPLQTLAAAVAKVGSGTAATIIVRGGTYREAGLALPAGRSIRVLAYPGETPVFDGSQSFPSGWVTEGAHSYHSYTPIPVTDGAGLAFSSTSMTNLTGDGIGRRPDQAWVGSSPLRQVSAKSSVVAGTFFVDVANGRIYLHGTDVAKGGVAASSKGRFMKVDGAGSTLEGLRVTRYSNSAGEYGVILVNSGADNFTMRNVQMYDSPYQFVHLAGGNTLSTILDRPTFDRVTFERAAWIGISSTYVNDLTVVGSRIANGDPWDEFTGSPVSGAIKTSKNWRIKVLRSEITGNKSHGLWFDQSNFDVDVASNRITGNTGNGVFFEISDDLTMVNNYVLATGGAALKLAGSSGLKLVNNTVVGGSDAIGVYTDSRSRAGCVIPAATPCAGGLSSDWDQVRTRPVTLDWRPRVDLMLNNIVANPTSAGYCGSTAMCLTLNNGDASNPINTIIHKADATRGIPQTRMNGNVYVNGTSSIVRTSAAGYSTVSAWTTAMAASPVSIGGIDAQSRYGSSWVTSTGAPSSALSAVSAEAIAIPADANLNQYIPAGTKRYGSDH